MPKIARRDDVTPQEGEHKYGDVEFADSTNKKYPIDTPDHIRTAWGYIHHKDNAAKYDADEVETIKNRIRSGSEEARHRTASGLAEATPFPRPRSLRCA